MIVENHIAELKESGSKLLVGMTREEVEDTRKVLIAPGVNLRDLIQADQDLGRLEWRGDKLIRPLNQVDLNFSPEIEEQLRAKVIETGQNLNVLVMGLIKSALSGK